MHEKKVEAWKKRRRHALEEKHNSEFNHLEKKLRDLKIKEERKRKSNEHILKKSLSVQSKLLEHAQFLERNQRVETSSVKAASQKIQRVPFSAQLGTLLFNQEFNRIAVQTMKSTEKAGTEKQLHKEQHMRRAMSLSSLHNFEDSNHRQISKQIVALETRSFLEKS